MRERCQRTQEFRVGFRELREFTGFGILDVWVAVPWFRELGGLGVPFSLDGGATSTTTTTTLNPVHPRGGIQDASAARGNFEPLNPKP